MPPSKIPSECPDPHSSIAPTFALSENGKMHVYGMHGLMQMCAGALADLSQLATASAAFKAAAAVLQTIPDENERSTFHSILPQMLQVSHTQSLTFLSDQVYSKRRPCAVRYLLLW